MQEGEAREAIVEVGVEEVRDNTEEVGASAGDVEGRLARLGDALGALLAREETKREVSVRVTREIRDMTNCHTGDGAGRAVEAALAAAGVDRPLLARHLRRGLGASKRIYAAGKVYRVPDWAVRVRYLELAHRLLLDVTPAARPGDGSSGPGLTATYEARLLAAASRASEGRGGP